jgi:CubicO group peptidase (beta-lactamase class C family)
VALAATLRYCPVLATEPEGRPGIYFAYNNLATWMLSRLVAQHTGEDVDTIITNAAIKLIFNNILFICLFQF